MHNIEEEREVRSCGDRDQEAPRAGGAGWGAIRSGTMHIVLAAVAAILSAGTPPGAEQSVSIYDPGQGMEAYTVKAPAGWHVQGRVFYGSGCSTVPFMVFRATSPDGLSGLEVLPRFDWMWGNYLNKPPRGCLPLNEELSPAEGLRRLSRLMGFDYVGPVAVPPEMVENERKANASADASAQQYASKNPGTDAYHWETARAKVRYRNGTFPMEALLTATIMYHRQEFRFGPRRSNWTETCQAQVTIIRAREGNLDAVVEQLKGAGAHEFNPRWREMRLAILRAQDQQAAQQTAALGAAQLKAQQDLANLQMNLQQQQHDQLMATMNQRQVMQEQSMAVANRGSDMNLARQQQNWAASHAVASDWVDTALGQQTVKDPGTGQVSKVPAGFGYTWVDQTGKSAIVTHDPNVNPNGYQPGTWTLQQQVHGDGSSR